MGLFSFLKNAGAALADAHAKNSGKTTPRNIPSNDTSNHAMEELENAQLAMRITNQIAQLGLGVEGLSVDVDDDRAVVYGTVDSQANREKVILTAGNVYGIATVDDRLSVVAPEPEATFYTVQKGDSLSKIAKAHYGSYRAYMKIFEANRPMLTDPDKIYPGQVLRIPPDA